MAGVLGTQLSQLWYPISVDPCIYWAQVFVKPNQTPRVATGASIESGLDREDQVPFDSTFGESG